MKNKPKMERFYNNVRRILRVFYGIFFRVEVIGKENIPYEEGFIICPNHFSNHDPFVIAAYFPEQTRFMGKKEIFENPILRWLCVNGGVFPVDRSKNDIKSLKKSLSILKANENLTIFAEGTRNKTNKPLPTKPGVAMLAVKTQKRILPVTVDSNYRLFSKVRMIIGEPVSYEAYYDQKLSSDELQKLTDDLMFNIYEKVELKKEKK